MSKQQFAQLILGPVTVLAPSDFPDSFKSIMSAFRLMLTLLDFVVFESDGYMKQALLKWPQKKK